MYINLNIFSFVYKNNVFQDNKIIKNIIKHLANLLISYKQQYT